MKRLWRAGFAKDQNGTVLVETLIAVPVLTILTFGILEFGNLMWQRQQLQVGVRDAARYWSRCRPTFSAGCDLQIARNIAFYGSATNTGAPRVPGWDETSELTISPATPPTEPTASDIVIAEGRVNYQGSPVYSAIFGATSTQIGYFHTTRYQGW